MRLAGLIAAAALLAPIAASAQPAAPVSLLPGEVLLEIESVGTARSRPDLVRLLVVATSRGETAARARSLNAALIDRLKAAARSAGVAEDDIKRASGPWGRMGFVGNEGLGWQVMAPEPQPVVKSDSSVLEIRLRDPSRVEALRNAFEGAGAAQVIGPVYALRDATAALRLARESAVAQARAEAEDYARALGLRVSRLLRVSGRPAGFADAAELEAMVSAMYGVSGSAEEVETKVRIAADFALAPAP